MNSALKLKPSLVRTLVFKAWQARAPHTWNVLARAARSGAPIESCEDYCNGEVRVWFLRTRTSPGDLTAMPWILRAEWIEREPSEVKS